MGSRNPYRAPGRSSRRRLVPESAELGWCDVHQMKAFTAPDAHRIARRFHHEPVEVFRCPDNRNEAWFHVDAKRHRMNPTK